VISIAYITGRSQPHWEWFVHSFCAQTTPEQRKQTQVIFIDGKLWPQCALPANGATEINLADHFYHDPKRRYDLEMVVNKRFPYLHIPPKPNVLQGPFKLTKRDFFCASNTRNTAIIAAKGDYLLCVDDLSVLMPGWIDQAMHAASSGYCVCGAYKKVKNMSVIPYVDQYMDDVPDRNPLVQCDEFSGGVDSRWSRGDDSGIVPWSGAGLFGCSFGLPIETALAVDGFEPACNGEGGEDFDFGIRVERSGIKIFYNRNMLTLESEEGHHDGESLPRERRIVNRDRLPAGYDAYQMPNQAEKYYSDHVLLNRVCNETSRITPILPEGLRTIRERFMMFGMVPIPRGPALDWRDNTPLELL